MQESRIGFLPGDTLQKLRATLQGGSLSLADIQSAKDEGLADQAAEIAHAALASPNPHLRADACNALELLEANWSESDILPLLEDPDPLVYLGAADALCTFGVEADLLLPRLIQLLKQPEPELPVGEERIVPPCNHLISPTIRTGAACILWRLGSEAAPARNDLIDALGSVSAGVRCMAARALSEIGEPIEALLPSLREAMRSDPRQSQRERARTASTLIELGEHPSEVFPFLALFAVDKDWTAASESHNQLESLAPHFPAAIEALRAAATCGITDNKQSARESLARLNLEML